ncbi:MAG: 16S rRNA (cytidine(1402)-2'-O)-methyltransferase [Bacillota bacterium]|jgi:16S rRNA (cytidine1402-2'-O)-methyltransferase
MNKQEGKLYIVSTPIGNLDDITLRAIKTLKEVDVIAAEDTRHSRRLLNHLAIQKPLTSYFQHNELSKSEQLIKMLLAGKDVAIISDAGTPLISDPGYELVKAAISAGIDLVPIPGASAVLSILTVSGLKAERFVFEGFVPREKKHRRRHLQKLAREERTMVFYEAPHRLCAFLADLKEIFGQRQLVVGRELTKRFEEFKRGSVAEIQVYFSEHEPRGEFTIAVEGCPEFVQKVPTDEMLCSFAHELMSEGRSRKEAAQKLAKVYGLSVKKIYDLTL